MPDFDLDTHLRLTRYLSGSCSAVEAAELERWLVADSARREELDALRRLWEASAGLPPASRVDEMWGEVARRIAEAGAGAVSPGLRSVPESMTAGPAPLTLHRNPGAWRRVWRPWRGLAAAAGVALMAGASMWWYRSDIAVSGGGPFARAGSGLTREYRTARGQRATIQLSDGTRIELGVASVLRVGSFDGRRRPVELEGEAVFQVAHDPKRQFSVRSGNTVVEDLGTRFGVRAYAGDSEVRVVVTDGVVALRRVGGRPATTAVLRAGDLGTVDATGALVVRRGAGAETYLSWASGRLHFDNVPLAVLVTDLERWYDVHISLATPSLGTRRVTLDMPVSRLDDALDAVAAPLGLSYEQRGETVVLRAR